MSTLTTSTINTRDGATPLTITSGNSSGPKIVINTTDTISFSNSTGNILSVNNTFAAVGNNLSVPNQITSARLDTANIAISTNSFTLGTFSLGTSGYTRLPNGLLMQWGTVSVNATSGSVTFPTAFASNPYSIQLTSAVSGASANVAGVTAATTTTATVRSASTAVASSVYWLALGV